MNICKKPLALAIGRALGTLSGVGFVLLATQTAFADTATNVQAADQATLAVTASSNTDAPTTTSTIDTTASSTDQSAAQPTTQPVAATAQPAVTTQPVVAPQTAANTTAAPDDLGQVVVTAQRREEKIQNVPSTVTAISGTTITDSSSGSSAANVLTRYVASASAASPTPTRPRWWIRGVGTGAQGYDVQSPVGIYFDDVYFSNANATGQPIFDLSRVEVVEGPQGTLWGKNTTGGAVNIVSVKPSFTNSGYAKIDDSSNNDQLYEGAFGGGINDWLAARASFHAESGDSPFKNAADGSSPQFHDDAGRIQFLADISPDLTALLNVHFRDYSSSGSQSSAVSTSPDGLFYKATTTTPNIYASSDTDVTIGTPTNTTQIRQNGLAFTVTDQLGRNTLTSITGYESFKTNTLTNGPTYYSPTQALMLGDSQATGQTHQLSEEIRLASPRSDRDNWVIGGMWFTEDISSNSVSAILPNSATGVTPSTTTPSWAQTTLTQNTKSYSAFGSNTFNFTPDFNITTGLRYTLENKSDDYLRLGASGKSVAAGGGNSSAPFSDPSAWWLASSVSAPISTLAAQQASKSWGAWTYDATPEYKFSDTLRTYFRYAHGFRSGGFNTTALTQAAVDANGGVVNPEYLTSYELGLKSEWLDGHLIINGDIFHYDYDNIQVNVVKNIDNGLGGTTSTSILTNAARGRANGAELNLQVRPIQNLNINLASAWLDTRYDDYTTGTPGVTTGSAAFADYSGNQFVRSPHLSQVVSADYRLPLQNGDAVVFSTDWKYQSKQYYYGNDQIHAVYAQGGYTVGNARLSYVTGKLTFTGYVDNVTDKLYKIHSGTVSTTYYNNSNTVNWSTGRTIGASATVKF